MMLQEKNANSRRPSCLVYRHELRGRGYVTWEEKGQGYLIMCVPNTKSATSVDTVSTAYLLIVQPTPQRKTRDALLGNGNTTNRKDLGASAAIAYTAVENMVMVSELPDINHITDIYNKAIRDKLTS